MMQAIPMITYATIGTKGQIVIPKEARDKLNVQAGDKIVLIIEDGRVMMINPDGVQYMIQVLQEGMEQTLGSGKTKNDTKKKSSDKKEQKKKDKKKS